MIESGNCTTIHNRNAPLLTHRAFIRNLRALATIVNLICTNICVCVYDTLYHAHLRPLCALHFSMHLSTNVIIHMFVSRCWYKRGAPAPYWYWSVICKVLSESGYAFSRLAIHVDWLLWLQQISLFLVLFKVLWLDYSGCFCLSQPF